MKRFYYEPSHNWYRPFLSVALFLFLFGAFFLGISQVSQETREKQVESLRQSISRGIVHCYATEGAYPENLDYLIQYYDIHYDTDIFFVDYQVLGENIFPDVTILEK